MIATLVRACRLKHSGQATGALLITGALLATPFLLRYDLMLLAIPLVWLAREGARTGFRREQMVVGLLCFALPLVPLEVAEITRVLVAPLVIASLFVVLARHLLAADA